MLFVPFIRHFRQPNLSSFQEESNTGWVSPLGLTTVRVLYRNTNLIILAALTDNEILGYGGRCRGVAVFHYF